MLGTEPSYRAMLAVDMERSSRRGDPALLANRQFLSITLKKAIETAGVAWDDCHRTDLGDGVRLVFPRDASKAALIHPAMTELAAQLSHHNRSAGPLGVIRVRVAYHAGHVHMDDAEVVGGSLETLARMLEAFPLRVALRNAPESAAVALGVSDHIYEEIVRHAYQGVDPSTYRQFSFAVKETASKLWISVPGYALPESMDDGHSDARVPAVPKMKTRKKGAGNDQQVNQSVKGHAQVGSMIGVDRSRIDHVVIGHTSHRGGPTVEELWHQLGEIRRLLTEEQLAGRLDLATGEAAADEIRSAQVHLIDETESGRSRLVLALKRLKGLVEDLAELTGKVAAAISAARGL